MHVMTCSYTNLLSLINLLPLLLLCSNDRISNGDSPQLQIIKKDLLPHELAAMKQVKRVGFTEEQALQAIGGMCFCSFISLVVLFFGLRGGQIQMCC